MEDFIYFSVLRSTSVRSSVGFKISARVRQRSMTFKSLTFVFKNTMCLKHIVGKREFLWVNHCTKIFCFCVHSGAPDLIYPETSLYEHILWIHLEKNRTYARTFPVQRKEINAVVKVRFTVMYSSRKLNNKVITTACNFWRQIACSF